MKRSVAATKTLFTDLADGRAFPRTVGPVVGAGAPGQAVSGRVRGRRTVVVVAGATLVGSARVPAWVVTIDSNPR
jgi:hypothetical protein